MFRVLPALLVLVACGGAAPEATAPEAAAPEAPAAPAAPPPDNTPNSNANAKAANDPVPGTIAGAAFTKSALEAAKAAVQPQMKFDEAGVKLITLVGPPTKQEGDTISWSVADGADCATLSVSKAGDAVGAVSLVTVPGACN